MGFLDSVSDALNRGVNAAGRSMDRMKVQSKLNDINRRRQELAAQLGASLYEATKEDAAFREGREALYDGIKTLDAEREVCMRQLAEVEAAAQAADQRTISYTCVVCGTTISAADLFCAGCGTPADVARGGTGQASQVDAAVPTSTDEKVELEIIETISEGELPPNDVPSGEEGGGVMPVENVCPSCGAMVVDGQKFCMSCGTPLTS